ncbi:MAG: LamG domain-containing protein [Pirellulales bacterium]|nr:LamG domain-containing protein [Pirellulales bacterium]
MKEDRAQESPQDADAASREVESLLEQLSLSGLSVAEWEALAKSVVADGTARRRYVETMHLLQSLPYLLSSGPQSQSGADGMPLTPGATSEPASASDETAGTSARGTSSRGGSSPGTGRMRGILPLWAQAACLAFVVGSVGAWQAAMKLGQPAATPAAYQPATASSAGVFVNEHVGQITAISPAASERGLLQSLQVGQQLRRGEVVQLTAGLIHVAQHAGHTLLIEGPAEFSLMGDDCVFVRNGKAAVAGAGELTVQTPLLTAICRSAEATFEVLDDESARASVDSGVVALAQTPQEGIPGKQIRELQTGEGIVCSADPVTGERHVAPSAPLSGVVRSWREVELGYDVYERLVLASEPTAYWPLRQVRRNRRVLDLTQHGYDGMPVGNWPLESAVVSDEGVSFNGESYLEPDRKPAIDPARGFTVESWAKVVGGPEFQSIFTSRWVLNSMKPDCQCFGFTLYAGETDCWEFWTGSGVKGEVWQRLVSGVPIDRTRWNHVVATFTPIEVRADDQVVLGRARLLLNGQVIAEADHLLSLEDFEWPARIGAAEFVPRYLTSWMFQGQLSDVALYNRPLEPELVKRHYEAGEARRLNKVSCNRELRRLPAARPSGRGSS